MNKDIQKLINKLSEESITKMTQTPVNKYVKKVVSDAQANAPTVLTRVTPEGSIQESVNVGQMISAENQNGIASIGVMSNMVGYAEFGTGKYARQLLGTYDLEWKKIAFQFYVDGTGNTLPAPFIKPAFDENEKLLDIELQKMLDKL